MVDLLQQADTNQIAALLAAASGFAVAYSAVVWAVVEKFKMYIPLEKKDVATPLLAFGTSLALALITWGWVGDFEFRSLAPFLVGSIFISAGAEYFHNRLHKKNDE